MSHGDQSPREVVLRNVEVVVEFDPNGPLADPPPEVMDPRSAWDGSQHEDEDDMGRPLSVARQRFTACPAGFSWLLGEGSTPDEAVASLASALQAETWGDGRPPEQLADLVEAAKTTSPADLVRYLKRAVLLPVLSDEYVLVLR